MMRSPATPARGYPGIGRLMLAVFLSALATSSVAHGIKPKEKQFPAGVPVPVEAHFPRVALEVNDSGWQGSDLVFQQDASVVFQLINNGQQKHLFVIGNAPGQRDQALMHRLMPADTYDYPNTRHLPAGETAEVGWRFNRRGQFSIRCLVPAHQERERAVSILVEGDH